MSALNSWQNADIYYMQLAISEAKKGLYITRPNPAVGCVIVKNSQIIATGFHPKAGQPHAEVFALKQAQDAGHDTQGACAYVTLEPCSHTGRTPPCADALIKAGITRVVVASLDPNPKVAGSGINKLTAAGIEVVVGICADEAMAMNAGFLKAMATGMPYVRLKMAGSIDGRTAMASGESKWITGNEAREDVQKLRARSAAIITGSGTILADNPMLTLRSQQLGVSIEQIPAPKIVVVDRRGRIDAKNGHQIFGLHEVLVWREDLRTLLAELVAVHHCYDVMVEAGSGLSGAFIDEGLVDELIIYQAPCILGDTARAMFGCQIDRLSDQHRFGLISVDKLGQDLRMIYKKLSK